MSATVGHNHPSEVFGFNHRTADGGNRAVNNARCAMVANDPELGEEVVFEVDRGF